MNNDGIYTLIIVLSFILFPFFLKFIKKILNKKILQWKIKNSDLIQNLDSQKENFLDILGTIVLFIVTIPLYLFGAFVFLGFLASILAPGFELALFLTKIIKFIADIIYF